MVVATGPEPDKRLAYLIPVPQLEQAWPLLAKPYRGLFAFEEADARWFNGREVFTDLLFEKVQEKPVVAVIGASGSGKSSVVAAGLIPKLRARGGWLIAKFRPDRRPLYELAYALAPLLETQASPATRITTARNWEHELADHPRIIHDAARGLRDSNPSCHQLLLVVDQFEELFTLANEKSQRDGFVAVLEQLGQQSAPPPIQLLLTMRADFFGRTCDDRRLVDLLQDTQIVLGPMTAAELGRAIKSPAVRLKVGFEDGLDDEILSELVTNATPLPLMEFCLEQLWDKQTARIISHDSYQAIGKVEGALADHAEKTLANLEKEDSANVERVRQLMMKLTHVALAGEQGQDTRRPRSQDELGAELWGIAQRLADARLVVTNHDPSTGTNTADLVHEALLRAWPRLKDWLDADRDFLSWQERLEARAREWDGTYEKRGALLTGQHLEVAIRFLEERDSDLNLQTRQLIVISRAFAEASELWEHIGLAKTARDAIWRLVRADEKAKLAFVEALTIHETCALKFNLRAAILTRALAGTSRPVRDKIASCIRRPWANEATQAGLLAKARLSLELDVRDFDLLFEALGYITNSHARQELFSALASVARNLTPAQAERALEPLLRAIGGTSNTNALEALGSGLAGVASTLTPAQAEQAAESILRAIEGTTKAYPLAALAQGLACLPVELIPAKAERAIEPLLRAIGGVRGPFALQALVSALVSLPVDLTSAQTQRMLEPLLRAIGDTTGRLDLQALCSGLTSVTVKLTPAQVELAVKQLLRAIGGTTSPDELQVLTSALASLRVELTSAQTKQIIRLLLRTINDRTTPYSLRTLYSVLATLPVELESAQGERAFKPLLRTIGEPKGLYFWQAPGSELASLASKLSPAQAERAFEALLRASRRNDSSASRALRIGLSSIGSKLTPERASRAIDPLIRVLECQTAPHTMEVLAWALASLPGELTSAQARRAMEPLLRAIGSTTDPDGLQALASGLAALPVELATAQTEQVFEPLLRAIGGVSAPYALHCLGSALASLADKLTSAQAGRALEPLLQAIGRSTARDDLPGLGLGLRVMLGKLTLAQAQRAIEPLLRSILGTTDPYAMSALASGLESLATKLPPAQAVLLVVEALKVPFTAGKLTDLALEVLRKSFPEELRDGNGFWDIVAWIENRFPEIDLASPPRLLA